MRPSFYRTLSSCAIVVSIAAPQQRAAQSNSPLEQLDWLTGGTWMTQERGNRGETLDVRLVCRWAGTRQAILFTVSFSAGTKVTSQYDGMFIWHPGKGKLVLWQVDRDGQVAEGEIAIQDGVMHQEVHVSHFDGTEHFIKAEYAPQGRNAFRFKGWFRRSQSVEWMEAQDVVYGRH